MRQQEKLPKNFLDVVAQRELGVESYVVLGNFLDTFYAAKQSDHSSFIASEPPLSRLVGKKEYAYYAAMAESLAQMYKLSVPSWTNKHYYFLSEQDADVIGRAPGVLRPEHEDLIRRETPSPFARRNVFVSPNALTRI